MDDVWLAKLNHHATTVQIASEKVLRISSQPSFDEQRAQMALQLVREGHRVFEAFSNEIREADLSSMYYSAAAEVDDAWTNVVKLLLTRLLEFQNSTTHPNTLQNKESPLLEIESDVGVGNGVVLNTEPSK